MNKKQDGILDLTFFQSSFLEANNMNNTTTRIFIMFSIQSEPYRKNRTGKMNLIKLMNILKLNVDYQ